MPKTTILPEGDDSLDKIYTIGYSCFDIDSFIRALKKYTVTCLVDVRSLPKSAHFKDFNRENLSRVLTSNGILYRNYIREFGARQTDEKFFTDGRLDFKKFSQSEQFLDGVKKIEAGMDLGYTFALMCAEKRPENCHRCILVARKFHQLGYEVRHILDNGEFITQEKVEEILLDKYFPKRNQLSLFGEPSREEMIDLCYTNKNLEIGYRMEADE